MKVGHKTDTGRCRTINEDNLHVDGDLGLFIVADGLGGHEDGELASSIAVAETARYVKEGIRSDAEAEDAVIEAIRKANARIIRDSLGDVGKMGSTVVLALFAGCRLIVAHVGDSRAYHVHNGSLKQLTHDHSFVADWLRDGKITLEQAKKRPDRHGLYAALGFDENVEIDISEHEWNGDSCILLCSDGLTDMLDDDEIMSALGSTDDPQEACDLLVDRANQKGGEDNITVIYVCG